MMTEITTYVFSSISSTDGGTRDVAVDCTNALETSETVFTVDITSSDDAVLTATGEIPNPAAIDKEDGGTIAINKGFQFQIATQSVVQRRDILLSAIVTGDSGSKETFEILVPVVDKKRK